MHVCLCFTYLQTGGVQTLMVRMAEWLTGAGHQVTIIAGEDGPMRSAFPPGVRVIVDSESYKALARCAGGAAARSFLRRHVDGPPVDVFYSFCHDSLWVAAALLNAQRVPARCLAGVYTIGDYLVGPRVRWSKGLSALAYPARYLFQYELSDRSRIFVNSALKEYVGAHSRRPVEGRIWPLPVNGTPYRNAPRRPERGLIVSVGRLAPMKEYNLWMIDVVRDLLQAGHEVRWEVYGEGPFRDEMQRKISEYGIDSQVRLKGEVAYARLSEVFSRAHIFVGMGTTLVEAAFAGVPAITARAHDAEPRSYGFFHQLPEYSCGEPVDMPMVDAGGLIREVLSMDAAAYARHAAAERQRAERFDQAQLMPRFVDLAMSSPLYRRIWRPAWSLMTARLYRRIGGWRRSAAAKRRPLDAAAEKRLRMEQGTIA